jgi:hypothetical protein
MDRLEKYLDQVCRSIGGPRELRQHVRQELREHLLDALAQHKAAGLPEEKALERALEDFGGPEQLRAELEATHGHRALAVVIDKAIEWKERTMKAKWLWASWAYLAVAAVLAMEALFLTFVVIFIIPKFQKLMYDGIIDPAVIEEQGVAWMPAFVAQVSRISDHYTTFMVLAAALAWGVFEWRVRSDNKPFMRLAALGTAALALLAVVVIVVGAMIVIFCLGAPIVGRMSGPFALTQIGSIEKALSQLEQASAGKDVKAMQEHAREALDAITRLNIGPALGALVERNKAPQLPELRQHARSARDALLEAQQAIPARNDAQLAAALRQFHESFAVIQQAKKNAE